MKTNANRPFMLLDEKMRRVRCPIIVTYKNTSNADAKFVLFGYNRYSDVANYGSDKDVVITVGDGVITYPELLMQSSIQPFRAYKWRLASSNLDNLKQTLKASNRDANGTMFEVPVPLIIYADIYSPRTDLLDFGFMAKVDGTFNLTGVLGALSSMSVVVFPELPKEHIGFVKRIKNWILNTYTGIKFKIKMKLSNMKTMRDIKNELNKTK